MKYLSVYLANMAQEMPVQLQVNKLKQLLGFLFKRSAKLLESRILILRSSHPNPNSLLEYAKTFLIN